MGADARVLPQAPEPELSGPRRLARQAVEAAPLLVAGALLLHAGTDLLPGDPLFSKVTLARLLIAGGLVALVAAGARLRDFRTGIDVPVIVLLGAAAVTTYRQDTTAALRFLVTALGLFYLTVGLCRRSAGNRDALTALALVAVVVAGAAGIAQVAQDDPTGFYRDGITPVASDVPRDDLLVRAKGTFSNPALLAGLGLLLAPIGLAAAGRPAGLDVRVALAALGAVAYLGFALTFSRAAIAGALLGLGVAAFALRPDRRLAIGAAAGGLAAAVLIADVATGGDLLLGFGQGDAWRSAVERWVDAPFTGIGLGRAGDEARNLWLTWLLEAGPIALLAFLWIAAWLLIKSWRWATAGSLASGAALAALTGFFGYSLVQHPAASERVATAFWVVAGLAAAGEAGRGVSSSRGSNGASLRAYPRGGNPSPGAQPP